jgi:protocatechuate 3,4-dioxygenase, beta subunit
VSVFPAVRRIYLIDRRAFLIQGCVGVLWAAEDDPFERLPDAVKRNARRNGLVMIRHPAPPGIGTRATLVQAGERGEPLDVAGRVFAPDGKSPARGVTVYAYNTDADGYYGANRAEYPPRIYGWMKTGDSGEFELRTIRPGRYPGMQVPAHVHFALWGGGYPPQWTEELRFEGDSYLMGDAIAEDRQRGEFATIRPLVKGADGVWRCSIALRLLRESNFGAG